MEIYKIIFYMEIYGIDDRRKQIKIAKYLNN